MSAVTRGRAEAARDSRAVMSCSLRMLRRCISPTLAPRAARRGRARVPSRPTAVSRSRLRGPRGASRQCRGAHGAHSLLHAPRADLSGARSTQPPGCRPAHGSHALRSRPGAATPLFRGTCGASGLCLCRGHAHRAAARAARAGPTAAPAAHPAAARHESAAPRQGVARAPYVRRPARGGARRHRHPHAQPRAGAMQKVRALTHRNRPLSPLRRAPSAVSAVAGHGHAPARAIHPRRPRPAPRDCSRAVRRRRSREPSPAPRGLQRPARAPPRPDRASLGAEGASGGALAEHRARRGATRRGAAPSFRRPCLVPKGYSSTARGARGVRCLACRIDAPLTASRAIGSPHAPPGAPQPPNQSSSAVHRPAR